MGISGLLPFLKEASTTVNIKQFEGHTVAVDTYCWIYRGAFSCAEQLALGLPADGHVKYVLRYVHKLLEWNIKPIMIFDGSVLPSKKGTELKRKESKEMNRKKAAQCLAEGRKNEAREYFQRCIECTPKMALEVIKALHILGVDVVVAPYEADAQLAYLNKINVAQIIITEDSDLILFGCEKVMYKLDINGFGQLIQKEKIISITQFDSADNFERFRWMCILSGCDYLENLPGIGLGKAKKLLKSINKSDIDYILKQMPKVLKMPSLIITNEYIESFKKADKTFKYQIVFDPLKRKLTSLHPYGPEIEQNEDVTYAGIFYDEELSIQHSLGNIDVNSREKVNDFNPDKWNYKPPPKYSNNPPAHMRSVWSKNYMTFKNSTPFSNLFAKKETTNLPKTNGLTKTISTKSLLNSNENKLNNDNLNKRKFESLDDEDSKFSLSNDDAQESQEGKENHKRLKTIDVKVDLDNLLNDYSSNKPKSLDIESSYESSGYFSSNSGSISNSLGSPVLNKSSQKLSQSELNTQSNKTQSKNVVSILESLEKDFKPNVIKNLKVEILNSPIVTEKSCFFEELEKSENNKIKNSPRKSVLNLFEKFSATANTKKFSLNNINDAKNELDDVEEILDKDEKIEIVEIIEAKKESLELNNEISKSIIDDLGKFSSASSKSNQANNKNKPKSIKKSNESSNNTKPISDYFKSFEYSKTTMKLTK
ncbi:unnamed protein product [Brachionus calyciflorus]|uniref:Exonuclease 1 n=1 Tax=Brachionus calyciflorus TaxID=104777 RepID=A0A813VS44_9BILA|nr:unnamed protein product [Brachionus calyciflorus]